MALAQGPDAYTKYIGANSGELTRLGADPNFLAQAGTQNRQAAAQFFDTLGMAGSGDKYYDILDKREGRQIDRGKLAVEQGRLTESARQADMENARHWGGGKLRLAVKTLFGLHMPQPQLCKITLSMHK